MDGTLFYYRLDKNFLRMVHNFARNGTMFYYRLNVLLWMGQILVTDGT